MRKYLADTGPMAAYLLERKKAVELLRPRISRREVVTSGIVYAELLEYVLGLPDTTQRRRSLRRLVSDVPFSVTSVPVLERYALIRRQLRPPQGPGLIGDLDTLIAATAIERNLTLVTTDADFERVPGLRVEVVTLRA